MPASITRREFFQLLPFGLIVKDNQEAVKKEEPVSLEVIALLNIVSQHSELRDQTLLELINVLRVSQGMKKAELGHYGTLYEEE